MCQWLLCGRVYSHRKRVHRFWYKKPRVPPRKLIQVSSLARAAIGLGRITSLRIQLPVRHHKPPVLEWPLTLDG